MEPTTFKDIVALSFSALRYVNQLAAEKNQELSSPANGCSYLGPDSETINVIPGAKNLLKYNILGIKTQEEAAVDLVITEQDRADADEAIAFIQTHKLLSALSGKKDSGFTEVLVNAVINESSEKIGVLAYLPILLPSMKQRSEDTARVAEMALSSKPIGQPNKPIEITFYAFSGRYLPPYDTTVYTGHDMNVNLVNFFSRHDFPIRTPIKIKGRVKWSKPDSYCNDGIVTRLTHVKLKEKK